MSLHRRGVLVTAVLACAFFLDQATKQMAVQLFRGAAPWVSVGNFLRFEYAENQGAFLSLGAGLSDSLRFWLLTVGVALFLLGFLVYVVMDRKLPTTDLLCYALIIGGGASNLFDRAVRPQGRVIDFMNMGLGSLRTGIFNVADIYITTGIFLLFWRFLYREYRDYTKRHLQ